MCWSNLQPELVQQASPLKGLMQCQNLWLRGHPLFLARQSDKSRISFPGHSFLLFPSVEFISAGETWDVNETFSLEGRRIPGQRRGWSQWHPHRFFLSPSPSSFFFFFLLSLLLSPAVTSPQNAAGWLKSALCQGRHISERHNTCRNINKQQAADSSQALTAVRRDEGKVRTLGGCCVFFGLRRDLAKTR